MKKLTALLAACTLLLCGCGKGSRTGATLEADLSQSYAADLINMNGVDVYPIAATSRGAVMQRKTSTQTYLYDPVERTYREIEKSIEGAPVYVTQLPDGRLAAVYNIPYGRKGGMDVYDGKDRVIEIYDSDLKPVEMLHFGDDVPEQILYPHNIIMDGEGNWSIFCLNEDGFYSWCVLNSDLTVRETKPLDAVFDSLCVGRSGKIYGLSGMEGYFLYRLDAAAMTAEKMEDFDVPVTVRGITQGLEYELYYYTECDGIYGLREDGTAQLAVDYINSDLVGYVWECYALPNGDFTVTFNSDYDFTDRYYQLRPRTEEEIRNTEVISLAGVDLSLKLLQDVRDYNQSQQKYRIVVKDYADLADEMDYETGYSQSIELFRQDLLEGTIPDIICMDHMPYQQLSNKGMLTDFTPMLEEDGRFDPNLYHMNLLEGMENAGRLERIGFSFAIETISGKTELVGAQQGRTPEEYIGMIDSKPEEWILTAGQSKEWILHYYLCNSQGAFIDRETMTSSFNSDTFVRYLELAGSLQDALDIGADKEAYFEWMYSDYAFVYLHPFRIVNPIDYHDVHAWFYRYDDMTLVGYPDAMGGNGGKYSMDYTIALTACSDKVEPVWEFIMNELSSIEQSQKCLGRHASMPIMRETLANSLFAATNGAMRPNGNANEQEMAELEAYVEGLRMYNEADAFVSNIILEEANMYFAGDQTAERAAEMIQKRADLYLSEQN